MLDVSKIDFHLYCTTIATAAYVVISVEPFEAKQFLLHRALRPREPKTKISVKNVIQSR